MCDIYFVYAFISTYDVLFYSSRSMRVESHALISAFTGFVCFCETPREKHTHSLPVRVFMCVGETEKERKIARKKKRKSSY